MYGAEKLQELVRHHIALGEWLAEQVQEDSRWVRWLLLLPWRLLLRLRLRRLRRRLLRLGAVIPQCFLHCWWGGLASLGLVSAAFGCTQLHVDSHPSSCGVVLCAVWTGHYILLASQVCLDWAEVAQHASASQ
jgi:hypothetical protein